MAFILCMQGMRCIPTHLRVYGACKIKAFPLGRHTEVGCTGLKSADIAGYYKQHNAFQYVD